MKMLIGLSLPYSILLVSSFIIQLFIFFYLGFLVAISASPLIRE